MPSESSQQPFHGLPEAAAIIALANKSLDGDAAADELADLMTVRESIPAGGLLNVILRDLDRGHQWLRGSMPSAAPEPASSPEVLPEWWRHVYTWVADGTGYHLPDDVSGRHASAYRADLELAERIRTGDERAATKLYFENRELVRALIRSRGLASEMDDVMQEVFARVFRKLALYRGESSFKTWIYRVALRHLLNLREQRATRARREVLISDLDGVDDEASFLSMVTDESPSPLDRAEAVDASDGVRATLDHLPEYVRQVVELRMLDEMSCREISDILAISEGTVRSRLTQGRIAIGQRIRVDTKR